MAIRPQVEEILDESVTFAISAEQIEKVRNVLRDDRIKGELKDEIDFSLALC